MELIKKFPETIIKGKEKPTQHCLFKVREESQEKPLPQEKAEYYHTVVAKILFLCKIGRPDTPTATEFITTRVHKPDQDEWNKLKRVMECLKQSKDLELTLSADKLNVMKWHIDAIQAVHPDMKGQKGVVITLGKGFI